MQGGFLATISTEIVLDVKMEIRHEVCQPKEEENAYDRNRWVEEKQRRLIVNVTARSPPSAKLLKRLRLNACCQRDRHD